MTKLNHHFQKLPNFYFFAEIEKRISAFKKTDPKENFLNLGIGDVSHPLFFNVVEALTQASLEMGQEETLRGYGPCDGYLFLRKLIAEIDYNNEIAPDEIFISDGINSDISNIQEIFSSDNRIAVMDPTYPVYIDTNVMAGRTKSRLKMGKYGGVTYLNLNEKNQFQPQLPNTRVDLIYLCSPNNPTGVAMDQKLLSSWVDYARKQKAVILFDGAYQAFITSNAPRSIYEIEGAKEVAIEFRSFSKNAGFTGLRCSYTVIPHLLQVRDMGTLQSLNRLWRKRVDIKSNGISYPIQKAAAALYTPTGLNQIKATVQSYNLRAQTLLKGLKQLGYTVYGGIDSPYIWCKVPPKTTSWEFFDFLVKYIQVIALPGLGFGKEGDSFVRFSAFAKQEVISQALMRFQRLA